MGRKITPLFYRYLLSYVILLLIPILLIGLLDYQRFVGILQEEITLGHRHVLEQARSTFEAKINEMNKIAIEVSSKPELSPYKLNKSMSYALDAKDALRYTAANQFIHNVVLYLKDNPYMYSANTTYPVSAFAETIYQYQNWPSNQFLSDIRNLKKPVLRPAEPVVSKELNSDRTLTYMVPIPYNSASPYGVLLFFVEEDSVTKLLEGTLEERNGNSLILNGDGQIIAAMHHEPYLDSLEFKQAIQRTANGMALQTFNQQTYAISTLKVQHDGSTYVTLLPENDFLNKTKLVKSQFFLSVLILLLIGGVLIFLLMRLNYKPIAQLQIKFHHNKPAARNHLLLLLLRGRIFDEAVFHADGNEVGVVFTKPFYFVVLIDWTAAPFPIDLITEPDIQALEGMLRNCFESYHVDTMDETRNTFICAVSEEEKGEWHRLLQDLHDRLSDFSGNRVTMGVGGLYDDIGQVGKSYIEASTAVDYKLIKGNNTLITYGNIKTDNISSNWYPKEEMELLLQYMQQGDAAKVEQILQGLQGDMQQNRIPMHIARCICYDVVGCMIKTHFALSPLRSDEPYPDVFSLAKFDTMQDLVALVRRICLLVQESKEPAPNQSGAWIAHIEAHYAEHEFSVQRMADYFSVSRSYLNTAFKKLTGQTIMDFLDYYRLERAKQLLIGSDLPLKDVVQRIGYVDVSSFIRKFKQRFHVTPGEFRKLYVQNKEEA
ncbi:helix-turn-helix domain-containing protein [Paenibacillus chibensis]|uniref:Helix-turn-helix domain-containing protein n=1 Tax=Paenibacillus chibensis TaxID=59846 RepID=A0ABU6PPB4_9BACL|nr:helix-turn-helix domain-containing protein [Paenibacillus chibensis]